MNNTISIYSGEFLGIPAAALPDLVKNVYILNYNLVASSTLFFWDILLNLDKESTYIWKYKFSHITVLVGIIRFLVIVAEITSLLFNVGMWRTTDSMCNSICWLAGALWLVISTCVDILLICRVFGLYGRNKLLLWSLCVMEGVAFTVIVYLVGIVMPKVRSAANPFPLQLPVVTCVVLKFPNTASYVWLPLLLVQTILFTLALGRHIYLQKNILTIFYTTSHIYNIFIRDGVWVFFVLLVSILLYMIGFQFKGSVLGEIALCWAYAIAGLSAPHLVINLRLAIDEAREPCPSSLVYTDIRFNTAAFGQSSVGIETSQRKLIFFCTALVTMFW